MIISIASQKGGVAKTSSSVSIASCLAIEGKPCLLVDMDAQANSSKVLIHDYMSLTHDQTVSATILDHKPLPIYKTEIPNLDIVPAHIKLAKTDIVLASAMDHREARLKNRLDEVVSNYEHVFIDCPPALSWQTLNAFTASDKVLIIVSPGYFELDSLIEIGKTIQLVKENYNEKLEIMGYLYAMADQTVNSRHSRELLINKYGNQVFGVSIPRNTDLRDAHFNRQSIFQYNPNATSAMAYRKFIKEAGL